MRKPHVVAALVLTLLPGAGFAQVPWVSTDEAPRVRVSIEGNRGVMFGQPVMVRFEVSDNAYVAVVRVAGDGRMTILYPYSRTQRSAVRGGVEYWVRPPRLGGNASFYAGDQMSGYVFAIASYSPLDLSRFESRDYERVGAWSRFTQVNRTVSFRPDVFIDRFAAAVLWDVDTPYDYDVDYYHTTPRQLLMNGYAMCSPVYQRLYGTGLRSLLWDWDLDFLPYPYNAMCRDYYSGTLRCLSLFMLTYYNGCLVPPAANPVVPGSPVPVDSAGATPNPGVVRAGMEPPTPTPIPTGGEDSPPLERARGRFDAASPGEWDGFMSIPPRATRKMKADDARREATRTSTAGGFDRRAGSDMTPKAKAAQVAERGSLDRPTAPTREPVKTKAGAEGRAQPSAVSTTRSRDFQTTGSRAGTQGPDRVSQPAGSTVQSAGQPASQPGSLSGASTTEKKKPPM